MHPQTYLYLYSRLITQLRAALVLLLLWVACEPLPQPNTLTPQEIAGGWQLLFDGQTTSGWRGIFKDQFPQEGWEVQDGCLTVQGEGGPYTGKGGAIITEQVFGDFELSLEFRFINLDDSGIKYYAIERRHDLRGRNVGLEYQLWNDEKSREETRTLAALFDILPAKDKAVKPYGEFNQIRIVSRDGHVEHWLNGSKVLEYDRGSAAFRSLVAQSKFKDIPGFGEAPWGHILLQDLRLTRGQFRNIKIREFDRPVNTLAAAEKADGWQLLFDGETTAGWRGIYQDTLPATGWVVKDGALVCLGNDLPREQRGGSIITLDQYSQFELSLEFKIEDHANSGIKYFVSEDWPEDIRRPGHGLGLEYAIMDDENWPYDRPEYHRTNGSLYDFVTADSNKVERPIGAWNQARIVVRDGLMEHYLNGVRTVVLDRQSDEFMDLYAQSKYKNLPGFGRHERGHILLQDEGPPAAFRNIKLRNLEP